MNFTFFSKPLQRPQAASAPSNHHPVESTVVQAAATNRLRGTPLFTEQRMAWLQPPKVARATAAAVPPALHQAPVGPDHRHGEATATVTQRRLQPEARAHEAAAATAVVTTSSVCSGNGDRSHSQPKRSSHHVTDCSVSPDEVHSWWTTTHCWLNIIGLPA